MRNLRWLVLPTLFMTMACYAQETTIVDAKRALSAAKKDLEKELVIFSKERGGGAYLKSEYDRMFQERQLERKAERLGDSKENAEKYDIANRLETYKEKYNEEAFKAFVPLVAFIKTCRQYEEFIKQDTAFQEKVDQLTGDLDDLLDRHAPHMLQDSLKFLYLDDPKGKIGTFKLPSPSKTVTINGEQIEVIELVTLKDQSILLNKNKAKERKDYVFAEIVGKEEYKTDDGETITGILLKAY